MNPDSQPSVQLSQLDPAKEEKRAKLEVLRKQMVNDRNLPLKNSNLVFGEGNVNAEVLFIGEAPGFHEDTQKRPFVGQSGKLLDKMFAKIGLPRKDVYITNIVKRRPPENRDPTPEEIEAYKPYLAQQIEIINPKVIATLGRFSMNYFLPLAKMTADHGKATQLDTRLIFPLYHPAAALRAGSAMRSLETDFFTLGKILGIKPPAPPAPSQAAAPLAPPPPVVAPKEPEPTQTKLF